MYASIHMETKNRFYVYTYDTTTMHSNNVSYMYNRYTRTKSIIDCTTFTEQTTKSQCQQRMRELCCFGSISQLVYMCVCSLHYHRSRSNDIQPVFIHGTCIVLQVLGATTLFKMSEVHCCGCEHLLTLQVCCPAQY